MHRTVAFSRKAVNVFFHILTSCNLKCRHCYINPEQHGKNALDGKTIEAWLAAFDPRHKKANVIFLGGEPTLHPGLPDAIRAARRLGYHSITIDTNGYLFNGILEKVTPGQVDVISFSLDGATASTNDRIRGKGSFKACLDGIARARKAGFSTSLIYTVSDLNLGELPRMPDLLEKIGIDHFFIQVIGLRGPWAGKDRHVPAGPVPRQVPARRWLEVVPPVARQVAARGIMVTYPKVYLEPGEPFECAGLVAENYFVFPNGRVYRCPLCEDYPLHSLEFVAGKLVETSGINEARLFNLAIAEGCVMNKLIQPQNLAASEQEHRRYRIACCMLKEEIIPDYALQMPEKK